MIEGSICRIGVFDDGSFFTYAQFHFYKRQLGWLSFAPFQTMIENFIREKEQGFDEESENRKAFINRPLQ